MPTGAPTGTASCAGTARYLDLLRLTVALGGGNPSSVHAVEALATEARRAPSPRCDGDDLQEPGHPAGPSLGVLLRHLRHWWETRNFADRAACLARLDALLANRNPAASTLDTAPAPHIGSDRGASRAPVWGIIPRSALAVDRAVFASNPIPSQLVTPC